MKDGVGRDLWHRYARRVERKVGGGYREQTGNDNSDSAKGISGSRVGIAILESLNHPSASHFL
jgi:hypothetical protein